eukprot:CAMPEP_0179208408 /NCGR_PEP_ID=MMETSP0796-20121207/103935_1 /TAXON_ID=73915 /ORGANISM="Pyrodinium bahamense, Strain pbaha01" /LENGTH=41 /DNA_ID= /DNA_START= /DNA_END= /DNA_ORIENTATION=
MASTAELQSARPVAAASAQSSGPHPRPLQARASRWAGTAGR